MSIICLSSRGLSSRPENYSNFFGGRGVNFPKDSEICLIGGSIRKHAPGRAMVTITAENNTFACHYGDNALPANVANLFRDDIFKVSPSCSIAADIGTELGDVIENQCTISPLRWGVTSTITAPGWTMTQTMQENRQTRAGDWTNINNAAYLSTVAIQDGVVSTRLTPSVIDKSPAFAEDSRRLWNTDNQGRVNNFGGALEGSKFNFTIPAAYLPIDIDGIQAGIVTGDRLGGLLSSNTWVNFPEDEFDNTVDIQGNYQQKIDLGFSLEADATNTGGVIRFFKNAWSNGLASVGYTREYVGASVAIPAGGGIMEVGFRPLKSNVTTGYSWEIYYNIAGAGYTQVILLDLTDRNGTFPIGMFNGNQSDTPTGVGLNQVVSWGRSTDQINFEVFGCYDNAAADVTAVAPAVGFRLPVYYGTSYISDFYAINNSIPAEFKNLCQTSCTISDALGFNSGQVKNVLNTLTAPALQSDIIATSWNACDAPLVVQMPNLPISGYLGSGTSQQGGATALPIIGVIDGFQIDENPTLSISQPYTENWIKLLNKDSFTVNELQVRITDMYGVLPDYLDNPSHIWIKIRSSSGGYEKI
jgi:hypothetical protein